MIKSRGSIEGLSGFINQIEGISGKMNTFFRKKKSQTSQGRDGIDKNVLVRVIRGGIYCSSG
jgi:hypothetical protein